MKQMLYPLALGWRYIIEMITTDFDYVKCFVYYDSGLSRTILKTDNRNRIITLKKNFYIKRK